MATAVGAPGGAPGGKIINGGLVEGVPKTLPVDPNSVTIGGVPLPIEAQEALPLTCVSQNEGASKGARAPGGVNIIGGLGGEML